MTKRTVRAGKSVSANGRLASGDRLNIQGGIGYDGAGGTAFVTRTLVNAGTIKVQGGAASNVMTLPGGRGGVLDVLGVLTNLGSITVDAGAYSQSITSAGHGGTLVVVGTLAIQAAGSITLQGGTANGYKAFGVGSQNGGVLTNVGMLENAGVITLSGGEGGFDYGPAGFGSVLDSSGTLSNTGTIVVAGGRPGFRSSTGGGASLVDSGVMTNAGLIELAGGSTGGYLGPGAAGGTLTVSGLLTNTGSISLGDGGSGGGFYGLGFGGALVNDGIVESSGTIEVKAGSGPFFGFDGYGGQLVDLGTLTNTGLIMLDGGQAAPAASPSGGTMTVAGFLNSYGQIQISGGGPSGSGQAGYYSGSGGVLVDTGTILLNGGSIVVAGGQADTVGTYPGGQGGTLSIARGAQLDQVFGTSVIIEGSIAAAGGTAGQGGVLDITGNFNGMLTLQAGSAEPAGDNGNSGASMIVSGSLQVATAIIEGGPGGGSASATLTSTAVLYNTVVDNGGLLVLQDGASISGIFSIGMISNTGTINGAGTISGIGVVNDGSIDAAGGQLVLTGDTITSGGATGLLKAEIGGTLTISGGSIDVSQSAMLAGAGATLSVTTGNAGVLVASALGGTLDITGGGRAVLNTADSNLSVFLS